jgi:hypothetical protein
MADSDPTLALLHAAIRQTWECAVSGTEDRRNDPPPREAPAHTVGLIVSNVRAELGLWHAIDHADLLRRYVRLVVQSEGSDLLKRAGTGGVDATFSADELALLGRLSEEAMS